ncbi:MAG: hypothetical protein GXX84_16440 [Acidobacteria bacterium]|nr:hypothetical protein [Acidobacteriota bacterium]
MNKEEIINYLMTHEYSEWQEEDRDWLMSLDENKLKKMQSSVENLESLLQKPEAKDRDSVEEFVAQAPENIKGILNRGLQMVNEQKDRVVQNLVRSLSEEQLRKKSIEELEKIADIIQGSGKAA